MFYLLLIYSSKSIYKIKSVVKFCQYGYFGVGDVKVNFVPWTLSDLSLCVILIKHSWLFDIISGIILSMGSANERQYYMVTASFIGCAHA